MNEEKKSYYAIIPANVRYDKRLTLLARFLYGEITALCNEKGFCWANNRYFAELYEVSIKTISTSINQLKELGYIDLKILYKENSREIINRYITICSYPMEKNVNTPLQKFPYPMEKNVKDNNTINITNNNTINTFLEKEKNPVFKKTVNYSEEEINPVEKIINNPPIVKKVKWEYRKAFNKPVFLNYAQIGRIENLEKKIDNFEATIPLVMKELRERADNGDTSCSLGWVLIEENYLSVLNSIEGNKESSASPQKKADPYITTPIETYFKNEYKKIFKNNVYVTTPLRNKLLELNSDIEDFKETIPLVLNRLKNIKFIGIDFTPSANWLLKGENYTSVLNGEYESEEKKKKEETDRIFAELKAMNDKKLGITGE